VSRVSGQSALILGRSSEPIFSTSTEKTESSHYSVPTVALKFSVHYKHHSQDFFHTAFVMIDF